MNSLSSRRRRARSVPHAFNVSITVGVSSNASNRCSTVMNSCRSSRARWNASFKQYSSSVDSI